MIQSQYSTTITISASTDNGQTWTEYTSTNSTITLATLNTGDKLLISGTSGIPNGWTVVDA